jgi:Xaa-Pro dipeptidase
VSAVDRLAPRVRDGHLYAKFPRSEYDRRYRSIRGGMAHSKLDALIVWGAFKHQNALYLSNYVDRFQSYVVLPATEPPTLVVDGFPHVAAARRMSVIDDVRWGQRRPEMVVAQRLGELVIPNKRVGLVDFDNHHQFMPIDHVSYLKEAFPSVEFVSATSAVASVRRRKSPVELEWLTRSAKTIDACMRAEIRNVRPGATDNSIYASIVAEAVAQGGEIGLHGFAHLGSTSMTRPSLVFPPFAPSLRRVTSGDVVLNEISVSYGGYSAQLIRPVAVGPTPKLYRDLWSVALETYRSVSRVLRPGATEADVLEACAPIIDAGLTATAPIIHGWDISVEAPTLSIPGRDEWNSGPFTIEEGQIIVIEPNPHLMDGTAGIFVGDMCLVTPEGAESLHRSPLDFTVVRGG